MNNCTLTKAERDALFAVESEERWRRAKVEHLDKCPECRAEAGAVERLLKETDAVKFFKHI